MASIPHGRTLTVRLGVADGLNGTNDHEAGISKGQTDLDAYRLGHELGQKLSNFSNGEVSRGICFEIVPDRRFKRYAPPPDDNNEYRSGREFGKCLVDLIRNAER